MLGSVPTRVLKANDGHTVELDKKQALNAELLSKQLRDGLEIISVIGEGGMGTVFLGKDHNLDRHVAIKVLNHKLNDNPDFQSRFEREARAQGMLSHSGVVTVFDFGYAGPQPYIVMELVKGQSLAEHLPMPADRAVNMAISIADALAYAHERGLVHRDIKPENILVNAEGQCKITDFGIARLAEKNVHGWTVTTPEVVIGTPHYLPPEAYRDVSPHPSMDVYSMGVLIYKMVSGELPLGNFDSLDGPLDAVVRRALSPNAKDRYQNAAELREALSQLQIVPGAPHALPPEENSFQRAVALLSTVASASAFWTLVSAFVPKALAPEKIQPLLTLADELPLGDGRIVTWARIEVGPLAITSLLLMAAFLAYGLLRRNWRKNGLEQDRSKIPIRGTTIVLLLGMSQVVLYFLETTIMGDFRILKYTPVVGAFIQLLTLWYFWQSYFEVRRNRRSFTREVKLWSGLAISLMVPAVDLLMYVRAWTP